jgi:hypothetical protein
MITVLIAVFAKLNGWLFGAFTRLTMTIVNHGTASKVVSTGLMVVTLPIILRKLLVWMFESGMEGTGEALTGLYAMFGAASVPGSMSWSGFTGYLVLQLGLDHCLAIVLTFAFMRFVMSFIPFVGPK